MSQDKLYYGDKVCDSPNWSKEKMETFKVVFPTSDEHCGFKPCNDECWDKIDRGLANLPLDMAREGEFNRKRYNKLIQTNREIVDEYIGDLSEGAPPDPPTLQQCQAIVWLLDHALWGYTDPLCENCKGSVGDGSRHCPECGRLI
jgi:hypothetical protein